MVFKSFSSDIDKVSSRWGMFGRSFSDIGAAISGRISDINRDFQSTNSLIASLQGSDSIWKRLYPSKASIQPQLIDVDAQYPKIDKDNFDVTGWIKDINLIDKAVQNGTQSWQDYYYELDESERWIAKWGQETQGQIRTEEDMIRANQAARNSALAHNEALKAQTLSAKAGKVAFQALATVSNMVLFTAIMQGIQFVTNAIDSWIRADEIALEKAEAAQSRIDDINSSYKSHKDTAEELGASYERLSKGVDVSTNTNLSLSDEDYKSYLDITNQLVEAFPMLRTGVDDNGNALLSLGQNGRTASEELAELLKTEEELNNYKISQDLDTVFKGVSIQVKEAETYREQNSGTLDSLETVKNILKGETKLPDSFRISGNISNETDSEYYNVLYSALQNVYDSLDTDRKLQLGGLLDPGILMAVGSDGSFDFQFNAFPLYEKEIEQLQKEISEQSKNAIDLIDEQIGNETREQLMKDQQAELAWKDSLPSLAATMKSQNAFKKLGEGKYGESMQDFAMGMVSNLDKSTAEKMETSGGADKWVWKNILFPLMNLDDADKKVVANAYSSLLALNPNDLSDQNQARINQFTSLIAEKLEQENEEIRLNLGFNVDEELEAKYDTAVENAAQKLGSTKGKIENIFTDLGIDTTHEIDVWNKYTVNAKNAAEAMEMYKNAGKADSLSFSEAWNSLDATEDESLKSLKDNLLSLAEAGQLTIESFSSTKGSDTFLSQLGLEPENAVEIEEIIENINELVSSSDQLASMEKGISGLSENLYAKQQNPNSAIGAETFSGMDAGLKEQSAEWDNYVSVLGNASSSIEEVQAATDKLASAYINSNNFLANLTETNKGYYISQLQAMGIDNAEELVQQKLTEKYQTHELQLKALDIIKDGVNSKTRNAVAELLNEAGASDEVKRAVVECVAAEQMFTMQDLGNDAKITQLQSLMRAFYGVGAAAKYAAAASNKDAKNPYEEVTAEVALQNTLDSITAKSDTQIKITGGSSNKTGGGNSTPTKTETPETFDFIETALSRIKSKIEDVKDTAKEAFQSFKTRGKSYADAISKITNEIVLQNQAMEKYMEQANNVGLNAEYITRIQDGSLEIKTITDEGTKQRIREYKEWYEKALACRDAVRDLKKEQEELARESIELTITKYDKLSAKAESNKSQAQANISYKETRGVTASQKDYAKINNANKKQISHYRSMNAELNQLKKTVSKGSEAWMEYQERIDANNKSITELKSSIFETAKEAAALAGKKAEKTVAKRDSNIELLDAKIENAKTAKDKNAFINSKIGNIKKKKTNYKTAVSEDKRNVRKTSRTLKKFKKTSKNKAVLKKIKACVKSKKKIGSRLLGEAAKLNDNGKLLTACANYNSYMDALQTDKETSDLFAQTSKTEIANLALEKFSNISDKWDNTLYKNTQKETSLNNRIALNESSGKKKDNQELYKSLISNEENTQKNLIKKRNALQKQLDNAVTSGKIKKGSSQWLQMSQEIDEVSNSIDEAAQSINDYRKAYHSLQWDLFDDAMETLKRVNSEADYYIDMMADEELVDKGNGSLTDYGNATLALHKNNYQSYLAQAEEYKKEYEKLMEQIRKGELNAADPDVTARIRELEDEQRNLNLLANKELQMGKDLLQDVYDKQLEKVSNLISKYKELMNTEKDAYEYQRTIEQKVKDLAALQKRMDAYSTNDDTEENRARIQKIKMELADAKQDLKDTQYDKYLSDTENMLDELYDDMESFFDEKLGNTDAILEAISDLLGTGSGAIIETLKSIDSGLSSTLEGLIKGQQQTTPKYAVQTAPEKTDTHPSDDTDNAKNGTTPQEKNSLTAKKSANDEKFLQSKKPPTAQKSSNDKKTSQNSPKNILLSSEPMLREDVISQTFEKNIQKILKVPEADDTNHRKNLSVSQIMESLIEKSGIDGDSLFQKFSNATDSVQAPQSADILKTYEPAVFFQESYLSSLQSSLSKAAAQTNSNMGMQNVSIDLGGITMNGVNDPKAFGQQLREEICRNGQTTKCVTEAVISNAMGNGIGGANFYRH